VAKLAIDKVPPVAIGIVMAVSLTVAVAGRLTHAADDAPPPSTVVATRDLRFEDGPAGSVLVRNAQTNATIDTLTGENGFIRGTMRGLARNRKSEGLGNGPAFRLTSYADGRLTLTDTANQRQIELEAFGTENRAKFDRLLALP